MKITAFYIWLGIILYQTPLLSQNHWKFINDNPPHTKVYSSYVIGNTAYFWGEKNIVFKTSNAGKTFEVLPQYSPIDNSALGCCSNHGIAFADSINGYITDIAHGEFRTTNGGRTWLRTANSGSNIQLVEFGSTTVGWKVGDGGFYKTINAGESWTYISAPFFNGGVFSNIYALDERNIWIIKSYYRGRNPEGSVWFSSNGGSSWKQLQTGLSTNADNQVTYSDFIMKASGEGIAIGEINRPLQEEKKSFIQKTDDFGLTWQTVELSEMHLHNIIAVDDSIWVIVGNTGSFLESSIVQLRSIDNGETWSEGQPFLYNGYNYMYSAAFIPLLNTILVSTIAGVYKSIDKGKTYSHIKTKYGIYVTDIALDNKPITPDSQIIIARSFNREYLLSKDAGSSWEKKEIPIELGYGIWNLKISENVIYIIVDQSRLYKSFNFGESWSQIFVNYGAVKRALDVFDKNTLVVQSYPNLCTSFDGGMTWVKTPFGLNFWLNESFMISTHEIVATGGFYSSGTTKGFLFKTSDNGFDWRIEDLPQEAKQIKMITHNKGFALAGSALYATDDAGDSWVATMSANVSAFSFQDSLNGLLHFEQTFMETKNGGSSWHKLNMDYPFEYVSRLDVTDKGNYLAVSGGNLLFNSSANSMSIQPPANKLLEKQCVLFQNSPNPFNPSTVIRYEISAAGFVTLKIYDILGREVSTLINEELQAGSYKVDFNASAFSSGVYLYRLSAGDYSVVKKMVILK